MTLSDATHQAFATEPEPGLRDYFKLLKPRVMALVVFTALAAMLAAPSASGAGAASHPVLAFAALLCIAIGAGAAGALNMWYDADIDADMARTRGRPVPTGAVEPETARDLGIGLSVLSVAMLGVIANPLSAALLAFTIFFYAVIYTMWLKRATPQNIVIGGAAGAFPPVVAWAAVTGEVTAAPILMFLVIFLWTPPHFWALALWRCRDYAGVRVPMMPVVAGPAATRGQILAYTLVLVPVSLLPAFTDAGGPISLAVALVMGLRFLARALVVARRSEAAAEADGFRAEKRMFGESILYLFALFAAYVADAALGAAIDLNWPVWI
ncbi:MAG: heme o synthase [Pseudomonadota bacterium]